MPHVGRPISYGKATNNLSGKPIRNSRDITRIQKMYHIHVIYRFYFVHIELINGCVDSIVESVQNRNDLHRSICIENQDIESLKTAEEDRHTVKQFRWCGAPSNDRLGNQPEIDNNVDCLIAGCRGPYPLIYLGNIWKRSASTLDFSSRRDCV